ncbi:MAG: SDR family oxidoreductase [Muribaculaceae bacterium]|nr:SDR family oxidoreductase [Muribaculaceae bacterium]
MADNYLERKMEEHRSGGAAPRRKKSLVAGKRSGELTVKFPPRRVLVTGGANGIGRAVVEAFRKADCTVDFIDIDRKAGQLTAQQTGARFIPADLADAEQLEQALDLVLKSRGDIDVVVSNAGIAEFRPLVDLDTAAFDHLQHVNLRPAIIIARRLALHRQAVTNPWGGRVILISSSRHLQSESGTEAYSASKGALASLTHALMMSLAPYGITVNSISPGWIETDPEAHHTPEDRSQHPSGRVGVPDDIARAALFLALPDNNFINGADIVIDGGMTHRMIYV